MGWCPLDDDISFVTRSDCRSTRQCIAILPADDREGDHGYDGDQEERVAVVAIASSFGCSGGAGLLSGPPIC